MKKFLLSLVAALSIAGCGASQFARTNTGSRVVVVNQSTADICHLYIAPQGTSAWSADLLDVQRRSSDLIHSGERAAVNVPVGTWDIHAQHCENEHGFTVAGINVQHGSVIEMKPGR